MTPEPEHRPGFGASPSEHASDAALFMRQKLNFIELETSSACSRTCSWCPTGIGLRPKEQALMHWDLFEKIISELATIGYAGELSLHGLNEPLQNPRLLEEYAFARSLLTHATLTCYTNGDHLDTEALNGLSAVGVDRVRVTLHAARAEPGAGDVRRLGAFLRRLRVNETDCVVLDEPSQIRRDFIVRTMRVEVARPIVLQHFNDRGGLVMRELALASRRTSPCDATTTALAISYTGKLKMCCNVSPDVPVHEKYILASLSDTPILDAYMSKTAANWRALHSVADWSETPICASCRHRTGSSE